VEATVWRKTVSNDAEGLDELPEELEAYLAEEDEDYAPARDWPSLLTSAAIGAAAGSVLTLSLVARARRA